MLGATYSLEGRLSGKPKGHEHEAEEIELQHFRTSKNHGSTFRKDAEAGFRKQQHQTPCRCIVNRAGN